MIAMKRVFVTVLLSDNTKCVTAHDVNFCRMGPFYQKMPVVGQPYGEGLTVKSWLMETAESKKMRQRRR
jgi:hypothetical protein